MRSRWETNETFRTQVDEEKSDGDLTGHGTTEEPTTCSGMVGFVNQLLCSEYHSNDLSRVDCKVRLISIAKKSELIV